VVPKISVDGILAVAVPGLVAGLVDIHRRFGKLPLSEVMQPAIDLAEKGFSVYPSLQEAMVQRQSVLKKFSASKSVFLKLNGEPYKLGEILIQRDLAKTLRLIAKEGKRAFYNGELTEKILDTSKKLHGLLAQFDFDHYEMKTRQPVEGMINGLKIVSMPPPSSGGTHLIEILNILENDSLKNLGFQSAEGIHLIASAMQRAFADRAEYMGDPDFVDVPTNSLISKKYAKLQRSKIGEKIHTPSAEVKPGELTKAEAKSTSHFSIIDDEGNAVSSTQTINGLFGSGVIVAGTGIVLNNEMDDFSAKPGSSNIFGAVGGDKNAIAPLKTPLSSMSPTIVFKNDLPIMSLGARGGTRIINCVAQVFLNYFEYKLPLYESVAAVRFHHQWLPDVLDIDAPGLNSESLKKLNLMGYKLNVEDNAVFCKVIAVAREKNILHGVADPRDIGTSLGD
jgi:gamma-glutamyltranspeptidase/glutathione hydrolase